MATASRKIKQDNVAETAIAAALAGAGVVVETTQDNDMSNVVAALSRQDIVDMVVGTISDNQVSELVDQLVATVTAHKDHIAAIRDRIAIAELLILVPAINTLIRNRNSNPLCTLIAQHKGLTGKIKHAMQLVIPNMIFEPKGNNGKPKLSFEPWDAKGDGVMKAWPNVNWTRWEALVSFYREAKDDVNPLRSDSWDEIFPKLDKSMAEIQLDFAKATERFVKKGMTVQDMIAMLQAQIAQPAGNLEE